MAESVPVLTIDGPSGAGKGTVSKLLAKRLGWHFLDSGAIYRALAWAVLSRGVSLEDEEAVARMAMEMTLEFICNESVQVLVDGKDVTDELQTEECGRAASTIAAVINYTRMREEVKRRLSELNEVSD